MKVGDKVWLKPITMTNAHRRNCNIQEGEISSIGRVYIEVGDYGRFNKHSLRHYNGQFSAQYELYLTKEECDNKVEIESLSKSIKKACECYGAIDLPLESLRTINSLLNQKQCTQ